MDNDAQPLASTEVDTSEATTEALARQALSAAPGLTKTTVLEAVRPLLAEGWVCFQDLYRPEDGTEPVSFVLVGPGGTVVLDTASSIAADSRARLAAGAGVVAATLTPTLRASVRSLLVVPESETTERQAAAAAVEAVEAAHLAEWCHALPAALDAAAVEQVSDDLRGRHGTQTPQLLTTADLLPVSEGRSDAELHRPVVPRPRHSTSAGTPESPVRRRLRRPARDDAKDQTPREKRPSKLDAAFERPQLNLTDVLRIVMISLCALVALWFWGVLSATATSENDRSPIADHVVVATTTQNQPATTTTGSTWTPGSVSSASTTTTTNR